MDVTQAIYDALVGDATLVSLLGSYDGVSPADPAVFTQRPVPEDAVMPWVLTEGFVSVTSFDELSDGGSPGNGKGWDMMRDVLVVAENTGDASPVEAIAARVRSVLHRGSLTIADGHHVMTQCVAGPVVAPTDDTLVGRLLTFRIVAMEA